MFLKNVVFLPKQALTLIECSTQMTLNDFLYEFTTLKNMYICFTDSKPFTKQYVRSHMLMMLLYSTILYVLHLLLSRNVKMLTYDIYCAIISFKALTFIYVNYIKQ